MIKDLNWGRPDIADVQCLRMRSSIRYNTQAEDIASQLHVLGKDLFGVTDDDHGWAFVVKYRPPSGIFYS